MASLSQLGFRWLLRFVGLMALVVLIPATAAAGGQFEVTIVDEQGEPVSNAELTFLEMDEEGVTDDEGRFVVGVDFGGTHTMLVEIEGHEPKWAEFELDSDQPGEEIFVVGDPPAEEPNHEEGDADSDGEQSGDEAVTVRTTAASPLDNPVDYQPLETLDREELQRRAANSYGQMLDGSPGVAMRSFGPAPSRPVIRGLGGERVLVLQNGERTGDVSSTAHDHHISIDPLESERIDIVRGPASLMYGSSALGGVVNIMDERIPQMWDDGAFSEAALYGATGQPSGAAAASAGYGFESSAVRGRISHRRAGDMRTPEMVLPDTGIQGTTADVGASTTTDRGMYGISMGMQDLEFGLPEAVDDPDESVELQSRRFFTQTRAERELSGFFEYLEWRLLANRYAHDEMEYDLDDAGAIVDEELELAYDIWAVSSSLTAQHGEVGPVDRGAVGAQFRFRDLAVGGEEALTPDAREGSLAAYAFEEIPVTETVRVQLGARPELHVMQPRANDQFDAPDDTRVSPTISGSAGVYARLMDELEVGAQLARAHRVPIVEELYSDAPHLGTGQYEIGDTNLDNEVGYGADLYTRWTSETVEAELSGFANYIDNFIFLEPTGDSDEASGYPVYEYESADARLMGAEFSATFRPWRDLQLGTVVDYVRGQRLSPQLEDLPSVPPLRGRFEAGWNADDYWSTVRLRTAASQTRTAPAEESTDGYALVDLEAGLRLEAAGMGIHSFGFRLDNAFDTPYRDHLSRLRGIAAPMPGRSLHATYRWVY